MSGDDIMVPLWFLAYRSGRARALSAADRRRGFRWDGNATGTIEADRAPAQSAPAGDAPAADQPASGEAGSVIEIDFELRRRVRPAAGPG